VPRCACLIALVVALVVAGCGGAAPPAPPKPGAGCARKAPADTCGVLFVGNSLTFVNDLPATFRKLAASGGRTVVTGMAATGGASFASHVAAADAAGALRAQPWNVVALQEQSEVPAVAAWRAEMYPAAHALVDAVRAARAQPLLFATWAHAGGLPAQGLPGYAAMQDAVDAAYADLGQALEAPVAPVGVAWAQALAGTPPPQLFSPDGTHPAVAGTYLAACVFYAAVFGASPEGLGYRDGLAAETAALLQATAARVTLEAGSRTIG
jgi:lysophospholipase L1-like esterase